MDDGQGRGQDRGPRASSAFDDRTMPSMRGNAVSRRWRISEVTDRCRHEGPRREERSRRGESSWHPKERASEPSRGRPSEEFARNPRPPSLNIRRGRRGKRAGRPGPEKPDPSQSASRPARPQPSRSLRPMSQTLRPRSRPCWSSGFGSPRRLAPTSHCRARLDDLYAASELPGLAQGFRVPEDGRIYDQRSGPPATARMDARASMARQPSSGMLRSGPRLQNGRQAPMGDRSAKRASRAEDGSSFLMIQPDRGTRPPRIALLSLSTDPRLRGRPKALDLIRGHDRSSRTEPTVDPRRTDGPDQPARGSTSTRPHSPQGLARPGRGPSASGCSWPWASGRCCRGPTSKAPDHRHDRARRLRGRPGRPGNLARLLRWLGQPVPADQPAARPAAGGALPARALGRGAGPPRRPGPLHPPGPARLRRVHL